MTGHVIAFPQKHSTSRTPVGLGLSESEFQAICRLCCQLPSGWLIERIEDPLDGVRAMLLKVSREESICDYGFVISREEEYLHLERLDGDDVALLGIFCSVPMALRFLRNSLQKPSPRALDVTEKADTGQVCPLSFLVWCAPE
jgi:hypothetical protein